MSSSCRCVSCPALCSQPCPPVLTPMRTGLLPASRTSEHLSRHPPGASAGGSGMHLGVDSFTGGAWKRPQKKKGTGVKEGAVGGSTGRGGAPNLHTSLPP